MPLLGQSYTAVVLLLSRFEQNAQWAGTFFGRSPVPLLGPSYTAVVLLLSRFEQKCTMGGTFFLRISSATFGPSYTAVVLLLSRFEQMHMSLHFFFVQCHLWVQVILRSVTALAF